MDRLFGSLLKRFEEERIKSQSQAKELLARLKEGLGVFDRYKDIKKVYIFGSVLRGNTGRSSDIDIYVENLKGEEYWNLKRELEELLGKGVDLINQNDKKHLINKIKERGKLIYERKV